MGEIFFDSLLRAGVRFLARLTGCEQSCDSGLGVLLLALVVLLLICVAVLVIGYVRKPNKGKHR